MKLKEQQIKIYTHKTAPQKSYAYVAYFFRYCKKTHVSVSHIRFFKTEQKPNSAPSFRLLCNVQGKSAGHKPTDVKAFNRKHCGNTSFPSFFFNPNLTKLKAMTTCHEEHDV